ncbi:hypothetical protein [Arcanobacterium sp. S3PF19]|uniref:YhgE/Pip domain-containing protein n=1 Tax=Arcanobacterium sp. S3PF19 TaxID=1219585 RepID=UPI000A5ABC47|nr:hypothetical protein [Arcanobacterium sp. S3PF19]
MKQSIKRPLHTLAAMILFLLLGLGVFAALAVSAAAPKGALVNADTAAAVSGKTLKLGDEVVKGMMADRNISWETVGAKEAERGLKNGTYTASVTIPADFTAKAASFTTNDASRTRQAMLRIKVGKNATLADGLVAQMVNSAAVDSVNSALTSAYLDGVMLGFGKIGDSMALVAQGAGKIADGAGELNGGLEKASAGGTKLSGGLSRLLDGSGRLLEGTDKLSAGAQSLAGGTQRLFAGVDKLAAGSGRLLEGADKLSAGAQSLAGGSAKLSAGSKALESGIGSLASGADRLYRGMFYGETGSDPARGLLGAVAGFVDGVDRVYTAGGKLRESMVKTSALFGAASAAPVTDPSTGRLIPALQKGAPVAGPQNPAQQPLRLLQVALNGQKAAHGVNGFFNDPAAAAAVKGMCAKLYPAQAPGGQASPAPGSAAGNPAGNAASPAVPGSAGASPSASGTPSASGAAALNAARARCEAGLGEFAASMFATGFQKGLGSAAGALNNAKRDGMNPAQIGDLQAMAAHDARTPDPLARQMTLTNGLDLLRHSLGSQILDGPHSAAPGDRAQALSLVDAVARMAVGTSGLKAGFDGYTKQLGAGMPIAGDSVPFLKGWNPADKSAWKYDSARAAMPFVDDAHRVRFTAVTGADCAGGRPCPGVRQGAAALAVGADKLAGDGGAPALSRGARQLAEGAARLAGKNGVSALRQGAAALAAGADKLAGDGGAPALSRGARRLRDGIRAAGSGAGELSAGLEKLSAGSGRLSAGADKLAGEVDKGKDKIPHFTASDRSVIGKAGAVPVRKQAVVKPGEAALAGVVFAVLLWCLGLLGAMSAGSVYGIGAVGVFGAVLGGIGAGAAHLSPAGWFGLIVLGALVGVSFACLGKALIGRLGKPGWAVALALPVVTGVLGITAGVHSGVRAVGLFSPLELGAAALRAAMTGGSVTMPLLGVLAFGVLGVLVFSLRRREA